VSALAPKPAAPPAPTFTTLVDFLEEEELESLRESRRAVDGHREALQKALAKRKELEALLAGRVRVVSQGREAAAAARALGEEAAPSFPLGQPTAAPLAVEDLGDAIRGLHRRIQDAEVRLKDSRHTFRAEASKALLEVAMGRAVEEYLEGAAVLREKWVALVGAVHFGLSVQGGMSEWGHILRGLLDVKVPGSESNLLPALRKASRPGFSVAPDVLNRETVGLAVESTAAAVKPALVDAIGANPFDLT
jgi:hypothetical protein